MAIVVLLVGFGSVLAAGIPLLTALISVLGGLACLGLLAAALTFATVSPTLLTMIGLGVGIDYALFLIRATGRTSWTVPIRYGRRDEPLPRAAGPYSCPAAR